MDYFLIIVFILCEISLCLIFYVIGYTTAVRQDVYNNSVQQVNGKND